MRARQSLVSTLLATAAASTLVVGLTTVGLAAAGSTTQPKPHDRERLAQLLLDHRVAEGRSTAPLVRALRQTAGAVQGGAAEKGDQQFANVPRGQGGVNGPARGFANVRVNDPSEDTHQTDQTTQSETSVAVAGKNVAVGFNDSQQGLLFLTGGVDLSGYGYSSDGGATFTDGGTIPNPENFVNIGDPWLASDRSGSMYYSTLTYGGDVGNLEVGVAKSTDGGKTWAAPTFASPHRDDTFYFGDKDALAVGPDPTAKAKDVLYDTWDDFSCDPASFTCTGGLPVSRSTDGGQTWTLTYADQLGFDPGSCSFGQYIGAQPLVSPAGVLYVAAEKIFVNDPTCVGDQPVQFSQVVFRSTDGGQTFGAGVTVASVTPAFPQGALLLGPGQFIRTIEFPTLALRGATLSMAWNDGASGNSHIVLAQSSDGAQTWTLANATSGHNDEIQPALSADPSGLHLLYYQRNPDNTLDVVLANSSNGTSFKPVRVTSSSFPGVETVPQFDPVIAFGYMGDYIANVSDGTKQYFAWGDNRDMVTDFTFPRGRHDPDVFFAHN